MPIVFEYMTGDPRHDRTYQFVTAESSAVWVLEVGVIKAHIAGLNEVPIEDGRLGKYSRWMSTVDEFKAKWGVAMVPPDIEEAYVGVTTGLAHEE